MPKVRTGRSHNPYSTFGNRPPFQKGDFVTPIRDLNCYPKFKHGCFKEILEVAFDSDYSEHSHLSAHTTGKWVLVIHNEVKAKWNPKEPTSRYNPSNFTKESYIMPQAMFNQAAKEPGKLYLGFVTGDASEPQGLEVLQGPFSSLDEVGKSFDHVIKKPHDRFVVLKEVMQFDVLDPQPPIRVTEFR